MQFDSFKRNAERVTKEDLKDEIKARCTIQTENIRMTREIRLRGTNVKIGMGFGIGCCRCKKIMKPHLLKYHEKICKKINIRQ